MIVQLAGLSFRPPEAKQLLMSLRDGSPLALIPEPSNRFDPFAVQIVDPLSEAHLGYVPRTASEEIASALIEGRTVTASLYENAGAKSLVEITVA